MPKTTRFDAADYLDTEERQVAYISAALETADADFVRDALGLVARARDGRNCEDRRPEPRELA
jgi:probable addiction module antidote protein